jgi:polysaccharide pyruvyl transferase WcaK-like protein
MSIPQPRIVLVNVWHDDNKGDGGIAEGALTLLQARWPGAKLGIVSMFPEDSSSFGNAHRHLSKRFSNLEVTPSPFSNHDPSRSGETFRLLQKVWQLPVALARLLIPIKSSHPAAKLIREADLVIANGGQYLFTQEKNYLNSLFTVFRLLYPLLLARSYRVPYLLFSQSFGFHKLNRLDNWLVRSVLSASVGVWAREEISYQALVMLGIPEPLVHLIPDAAFAIQPHETDRVKALVSKYGLVSKNFWVVTVRKWRTYTESFLEEMAELIINALNLGLTQKVVLVAHTQGPSKGENDRIATMSLAELLKNEARVMLIDDDLSPSELAALYGKAQLMIGTRFHSVIFSLIGGTPAYAVSYAGPKTWGIMRMLGLENLCSDMETFSAQEALDQITSADISTIAIELPAKIDNLYQHLKDGCNLLEVPT